MFRATKSALTGVTQIGARAASRASLLNASRFLSAKTAPSAAKLACPANLMASRAQLRFYSPPNSSRVVEEPAQLINYAEMKKLANGHDENTILVDVREPHEYEEGHIGDAVNIPFKSMPGALGLEPAEFEATLGFDKPNKDKLLVFYCLGGVRSTSAEQLASTYGYERRANYLGSYQDWLANESKPSA